MRDGVVKFRCIFSIDRREFVAALYESRIPSSSAFIERRYNIKHDFFPIGGPREILRRLDGIDYLVESGGDKILGVAGVENFYPMGEERRREHGVVGPAKRKITGLH